MAGITARALRQELAKRLGEYVALSPTSTDLVTTLIDTAAPSYLPVDIGSGNTYWNAWVLGSTGCDASNSGIVRRTATWDVSQTKASFLSAWPSAPSTGLYEVHTRTAPDRKLAAINAAIKHLGFMCSRDVRDVSLTTVDNQWVYTLPSSQNWLSVDKVEMQISVDASLVGYPYSNAIAWNFRTEHYQDPVTGVETWLLQFASLPPQPPRIIRVYGTGWFSELVADTDVLPLGGAYQGPAEEYIYAYATMMLYKWLAASMPSNQSDRYLGYSIQDLRNMKEEIQELAKPANDRRITVPGRGDGSFSPTGSVTGWEWLGAFNSGAFATR